MTIVSPSRRVVFIDLARAIAVLMMVQGHTIDTLLAPAYRTGAGYDGWLFLRGLTSCTFLTLSGVAFSVTAIRHWEDQLRMSARWFRRVRRFVFFLALGYLMRFPMGKFSHLQWATDERWQSWFVVDILHVVALTLLLLQGLIWAARTPRAFAVASGVLGILVVLLSPFAWKIDWTAFVPLAVASYLSPEWGSIFPALPWAGYILLGAAFGVVLDRWIRHDSIAHMARVLVTTGVVVVAAVWVGRLLFLAPYGNIPMQVSPGFFLLRLACVLVLLGAIAALSAKWRGLPPVVQSLAEESFLIYAVHVAILYGSRWNPGLRLIVGPQEPGVVLLWIAMLLVAMTTLAFVWNQLQLRRPDLAIIFRVATVSALVYPFLGE
ncbi:MAG: heparan-alpha-glucosaminide N-acetyltransferase domain-containing protein [Vicinamibacterales bacterium]|nr:heparan-alpha-glucosaminide N-acetyltransferase domain-containing protein [Vicinamibacterales bacterium]